MQTHCQSKHTIKHYQTILMIDYEFNGIDVLRH